MIAFGAMVVLNRNPVSSALSLVVSFLGLAGLFMSLDAYFIGIIQILVYAGAVMVLFLFIIMLMDLKAEVRRKLNIPAVIGGGLIAVLFVAQLVAVLADFKPGQQPMPALAEGRATDVKAVGTLLFERYPFHIQVMGVLLLSATIGVIALSKKESAK